jgi:hypothetical protein
VPGLRRQKKINQIFYQKSYTFHPQSPAEADGRGKRKGKMVDKGIGTEDISARLEAQSHSAGKNTEEAHRTGTGTEKEHVHPLYLPLYADFL